jgi:3-phosphoshikimate 1-carboxyvinyltransferase
MPIPDLIEIVPLEKPVAARISVPGSKSITNRALVLAALAGGDVVLKGALWSEDTQVMVDALKRLGFSISIDNDGQEFCNRTFRVTGRAGGMNSGGDETKPLELFVGNAGTAARFLAAFVCLGNGVYELRGTERMHQRPQAALFDALRQLGYRIDSSNDRLPARIFGGGLRRAACKVDVDESSQFASALLLCARAGGWDVKVAGESSEETPYVTMTQRLIESFPEKGGEFQIEADASSASYFWAAEWLINKSGHDKETIEIAAPPASTWQIDSAFPRFLPLPRKVSRRNELGDSIMTAIVLAPFASHPAKFTDLERLRVQECERVAALRMELSKCGARVEEEGDTLTVFPGEGKLRGARIETYNDHRVAMCFAVLGLKVPGIQIENPACVKKTFPNFFQKLAAHPSHGLGVSIVEPKTGRALGIENLFAD